MCWVRFMQLGCWGCTSPEGPNIARIMPRCLRLCMVDHIWLHLPPRGLIAGVTYGICVGSRLPQPGAFSRTSFLVKGFKKQKASFRRLVTPVDLRRLLVEKIRATTV